MLDKDKPLYFGSSDHIELITTDDKDILSLQDMGYCDILLMNLSLCAFYTEKIMYYELVQYLIEDLIRTIYCRLSNEQVSVLPKRIFLNHNNAKYSVYVDEPSALKVC